MQATLPSVGEDNASTDVTESTSGDKQRPGFLRFSRIMTLSCLTFALSSVVFTACGGWDLFDRLYYQSSNRGRRKSSVRIYRETIQKQKMKSNSALRTLLRYKEWVMSQLFASTERRCKSEWWTITLRLTHSCATRDEWWVICAHLPRVNAKATDEV